MFTLPAPALITVEEYDQLPDPPGGLKYELHFGELVKVGIPRKGHYDLQGLIRKVLGSRLDKDLWLIEIELPYGLVRTYDARATDVGAVLRTRWDSVPDDAILIGSPSLVVEVEYPTNMDREMEQDSIIHIIHGASAVLIVKEVARQVVLVTASARSVHGPGDTITLPAPLSITIAFSEIFPG